MSISYHFIPLPKGTRGVDKSNEFTFYSGSSAEFDKKEYIITFGKIGNDVRILCEYSRKTVYLTESQYKLFLRTLVFPLCIDTAHASEGEIINVKKNSINSYDVKVGNGSYVNLTAQNFDQFMRRIGVY
jgi:hypothetical protein